MYQMVVETVDIVAEGAVDTAVGVAGEVEIAAVVEPMTYDIAAVVESVATVHVEGAVVGEQLAIVAMAVAVCATVAGPRAIEVEQATELLAWVH